MLLLDADVLLIDLRYPADARFPTNRRALDRIRADGLVTGITSQALLETVGILSFNVSPRNVPRLPDQLCLQFRLAIIPDLKLHPAYAGCTVADVVGQMSRQMALGDAVQAVQIATHAPAADALLTWNARHFVGKLAIPVLTPEEWLNQRATPPPP